MVVRAIVGVVVSMIAMFDNIGPFSRGGATLWETKETLEGGLRIDRTWWAVAKVGAIVAASVLVGFATGFALL